MGGERASTTRQRQSGKICCECRCTIDKAPWQGTDQWRGGERLCDRCQRKRSSHRVLMNFMLRGNWQVSFLEEDCKTSLRKSLQFGDPSKIEEMARKGGADCTSAAREILEYAIRTGRGAVWLNLTEEQYRKLK